MTGTAGPGRKPGSPSPVDAARRALARARHPSSCGAPAPIVSEATEQPFRCDLRHGHAGHHQAWADEMGERLEWKR